MATKKTEIATVEQSLAVYPVLNPEESMNAMEVIETNLGANGVQIKNLDKVTVPPGGGKVFAVNPGDGEINVPTLTGIIVLAPEQNGFWAHSMEDEPNSAPVCFSNDGQVGVGRPGGNCLVCPNKEWGSDAKGKGKACRDLRPIFLLQPGDYLPIIVQTSRMSLKKLSAYFTLLARRGIPYYAAITEIGLAQAQNAGTPIYSVLTFAVKEVVPKEQRTALKSYQAALRCSLSAAPAPAVPASLPVEDEFDPFENDDPDSP